MLDPNDPNYREPSEEDIGRALEALRQYDDDGTIRAFFEAHRMRADRVIGELVVASMAASTSAMALDGAVLLAKASEGSKSMEEVARATHELAFFSGLSAACEVWALSVK